MGCVGQCWAVVGCNGQYWLVTACIGGSKSFGTHITENHLGTLFALFFGRALDQMGQTCQYLAKMLILGQIWPFWAKNLFFGGRE